MSSTPTPVGPPGEPGGEDSTRKAAARTSDQPDSRASADRTDKQAAPRPKPPNTNAAEKTAARPRPSSGDRPEKTAARSRPSSGDRPDGRAVARPRPARPDPPEHNAAARPRPSEGGDGRREPPRRDDGSKAPKRRRKKAEGEEEEPAEGERQAKAPWHFKFIVVGSVVYLGWRLYQGISWLAHHI